MSTPQEKEKPAGADKGEKNPAEKSAPAPAPSRYPLRVDVAKPAVVYQPSFGKDAAKSPARPAAAAGEPSSSAGGGASGGKERILGKRRRGGKTEFLVKRPGGGESTWESSKAVSASAVRDFEEKRQSRQLLQSRLASAKQAKQGAASGGPDPNEGRDPYRILAQRRFEGGQRYLVHWMGCSVTDASWESAKRINNPALVSEFENAVKRARSTSEHQLRSGANGGYTLAALGFANAHAFRGPCSRNVDGTARVPLANTNYVVPGTGLGGSAKPRHRNKPATTPTHAAPPALPLGDAAEKEHLDRRGLAPLGDLIKRRRISSATATEEYERYEQRSSATVSSLVLEPARGRGGPTAADGAASGGGAPHRLAGGWVGPNAPIGAAGVSTGPGVRSWKDISRWPAAAAPAR